MLSYINSCATSHSQPKMKSFCSQDSIFSRPFTHSTNFYWAPTTCLAGIGDPAMNNNQQNSSWREIETQKVASIIYQKVVKTVEKLKQGSGWPGRRPPMGTTRKTSWGGQSRAKTWRWDGATEVKGQLSEEPRTSGGRTLQPKEQTVSMTGAEGAMRRGGIEVMIHKRRGGRGPQWPILESWLLFRIGWEATEAFWADMWCNPALF